MFSCLFIAEWWSPEEKGLTSWLLFDLVCDVYCDFVTFPFGIQGQVWYLIVSIPDPCFLSLILGWKASTQNTNCLYRTNRMLKTYKEVFYFCISI